MLFLLLSAASNTVFDPNLNGWLLLVSKLEKLSNETALLLLLLGVLLPSWFSSTNGCARFDLRIDPRDGDDEAARISIDAVLALLGWLLSWLLWEGDIDGGVC